MQRTGYSGIECSRGTREPKRDHVRLESSGTISACYPDRSIMSVSHVERYHWVVKVARRLRLLGVEAWIVERGRPCYPIGWIVQPLFEPWPLICRFDRLCFCKRFWSSLGCDQSACHKL